MGLQQGGFMSRTSSLVRILIVEDDHNMREAWETVLDMEEIFCVLDTFESCEDLLNSACLKQADILLMDIGLPGMAGTEGVVHALEENPDLIIIMASVYEDDKHIFQALANGAMGYLHKKISPKELIEAIYTAIEGGSPMTPGIARKVISSFQIAKDEQMEPLSEREQEILEEMAIGKSYKQIGKDVYLSVDGVRYHIRNIYRKLQVNNRSEAVAKAIYKKIIKPD